MSKKPIVIDKLEWDRIRNNVNKKDSIKEHAEKQAAYIDSLNEASRKMTKLWTDSYEKVKKRQEDDAKLKKQEEEGKLREFYKKLLESKQKEREKMLADARDTIFKQKDEPKTLESAFMCADVLLQQQHQREFNKKVKAKKIKLDKEYGKKLQEDAIIWKKEQIEKQQRKRQKIQKELLATKTQIEEDRNRKMKERQEEIAMGRQDNENALKEIEALRMCTQKMKLKERQANMKHISEALALIKRRNEEKDKLDDTENKVMNIYNGTIHKIEQLRIQKEKEIAKEKTRIRDKVRSDFKNTSKEIEEKEKKILDKAVKEIHQREMELVRKEKEYSEAKIEERKRAHEEWLESEAQKAKDKATIRAWELANRICNEEHTAALNEAMRKEKARVLIENKNIVQQQQREHAEEKARRDVERIKFYHTDFISDAKAADEQFLTYANQLLEECEELGRPTVPLHRVIKDYKARYMQPEKRLPTHLKTHFPQCMAVDDDSNYSESECYKNMATNGLQICNDES